MEIITKTVGTSQLSNPTVLGGLTRGLSVGPDERPARRRAPHAGGRQTEVLFKFKKDTGGSP